MSCSQFIEHNDDDKSDTLVVIVNGDGTVSVDRETLERVLKQQCRAAVSFVKLEDSNEPDSQSGRLNSREHNVPFGEKDALCNKVNLVVEGYYPPPPLNSINKTSHSADSVVSSTVVTPPLSQSSSDFLDLLSEGLEIPVPNVPVSNEGCIGDSLVDAFSEMAPEQLKQVETALHSEKAKQILGDDVTSVLDTLTLKEDDWVHFDHCYTSIYGSRKPSPPPISENAVVQDDVEEIILAALKIDENESVTKVSEKPTESQDTWVCRPQKPQEDVDKNQGPDFYDESTKVKRKSTPLCNSKPSSILKHDYNEDKTPTPKRNSIDIAKNAANSSRDRRTLHMLSKAKRRSTPKSETVEKPIERIVTEDEVDGVKVFKPTRNDKKFARPFVFSKDSGKNPFSSRNSFIQTKLNFTKKEGSEPVHAINALKPPAVLREKPENHPARLDVSVQKNRNILIGEKNDLGKNARKETPKKQPQPVTPETFGPALFSTPDIIRKINNEETAKDAEKLIPFESSIVDETADIEKKMLALENGEAILDRITMQFEIQNKERYSAVCDEDRLLSDLENTDDEDNQVGSEIFTTLNTTENTELGESYSELLPRNSSDLEKTESFDREDMDYEDDPNKLWCVCNKPHGNRFMICCDACDNWYHGSCVGVTRPMGEKMELNGTEWLCPTCRRKKCAKEREAKLKLVHKSSINRSTGKQSISNYFNTSTGDTSLTVPAHSVERTPNQAVAVRRKSTSQLMRIPQSQLCIECKEKETVPNGVYCSEACIKSVVDAFINANSSPSDPLPDERKIAVVDKKRERRITGMRAPSVANLKEWLMKNPSFEIARISAFPIPRPSSAIKPMQTSSNTIKSSTPVSREVPNLSSKIKLLLKSKDDSGSVESSSQTSIKQYFGLKIMNAENASKINKIEDGSGNILIREGNVLRTVSTISAKRDVDSKMDKQRQIKLIPVQPFSKPNDEPKPTQTTIRKVVVPPPIAEKEKKRKFETLAKEKPTVLKKVEIKRQDSRKSVDESNDAIEPSSSAANAPESVRPKLKKSLSDLFVSRSKDISDLTVSTSELIALANRVEEELFNFFKDTGQKYKNKYRSLVFNLKDQKNNLFGRVADKSLTPHQLVRLTPEELASTELAQWREREAKHEIDMIKKTELENLSQSKVLVVKTHKGELEIESDSLPPSVTDTVVPDLQPDEIPVEADRTRPYGLSAVYNKDREKRSMIAAKGKDSAKEEGSDKKARHKKSEHRDRNKSRKHRHRSSERDHHRSRSRRRSKSGEKDGLKSLTGEKRSGQSRHRSRSSDKSHSSGDKDRSRGKRKRSRSRSHYRQRSVDRKDDAVAGGTSSQPASETTPEQSEKLPITTAFESAALDEPTEEEAKFAADLLSSYNAVDVDLSDMEPTSTVTIRTPPYSHSPDPAAAYLWKGMVNMPDLNIKLHAVMKEVSGNCDGLDEELPSVLECVGRLRPAVMWRYISEVKKIGNEIQVLRFEMHDDSQQKNYFSFYSDLSTKERIGVIKSMCAGIKDFYMMALASHCPIPQVLLPLDGPGVEDNKSHMLLAIIVRTRHKRHHSSGGMSLPPASFASRRKTAAESVMPPLPATAVPEVEDESYTPPHSPSAVFATDTVAVPGFVENDENEPYSPGGDDEEPYSPGGLDDEHSNKPLEVELKEIEREIAEEKQKIKHFEMGDVLQVEIERVSEDLYSPTKNIPDETETSTVQLPDDLQRLFSSFQKRHNESKQSPGILEMDPIVNRYKSHGNNSDFEDVDDDDDDDDVVEVPFVEPACSPSGNDDDVVIVGETEAASDMAETASPEDGSSKQSRDPRRKWLPSELQGCATPVAQLTLPGLEEEPPTSSSSAAAPVPPVLAAAVATEPAPMMPLSVADGPPFAVQLAAAAAPFGYAATPAAAVVPQYPSAAAAAMMATHPQMFMPAAPVFPAAASLGYGAMPATQMYVPPAAMLLPDPSMIPLPVDDDDKANTLKRKAADEVDDEDSEKDGSRKGDPKTKKSPAYYSTDAKSRRSHSRSPSRHKSSSSYDSHRRSYQRDDDDYGSGSNNSRYSSKHNKGYSSRRSSYWKSGSDYSSSSSHRKYSDRSRRSSRSSSREKSSRRYDSSKSSS